jgi:hypothetical protein
VTRCPGNHRRRMLHLHPPVALWYGANQGGVSLMPYRTCLEPGCPNLTLRTRCVEHERLRQQARNAGRFHYKGDYRRRSDVVRRTAVVCWLCGGGARVGDPWQADHVVPGDPSSELLPAHRSCNARRGAAKR